MKKNQKGFTLMEMLIVVAVIAILVAVAIPVMNAQMHKVKVRTDWANVRAYYAEIQTDYILTGEGNDEDKNPVYGPGATPGVTPYPSIKFLNGQTVQLKTGYYTVSFHKGKGYQVAYQCDKVLDPGHDECTLVLG